jgi:hypothetical protein
MTSNNNSSLLKLRAEDQQDLKVISACLQDAILPASAMSYHPDEKMFAILANRFMWEQDAEQHEGQEMFKRVHTGVYFSQVKEVKYLNIDQTNTIDFMNLLAISGDKEGEIDLIFSNERQICLYVDKIMCYLKDLHEPWHTPQKPSHAA